MRRSSARWAWAEIRIQEPGKSDATHYYLEGGVVRVADDKVSVLAESVTEISALDVEAERERLEEVMKMKAIESTEAIDARDLAAAAARARIRAAQKMADPTKA